MSGEAIPFNRPYLPPGGPEAVVASLRSGHLSGDGPETKLAGKLLSRQFLGAPVLLTPSCTHALEMAVRLLSPLAGHEIIVPSFTFTSTANAIVLSGATPVFVDIDPVTKNIDLAAVEEAITERTLAVFCINYAGVAPEIEKLRNFCVSRGVALLEDNAHGLGAMSDGRPLGTFGMLATQSFHETKNVQCGEGGCLVVNSPDLLERAEILREKGTDRSRFFRGQVDKYTWVDEGSSWLLAEPLAALLKIQLEMLDHIQDDRSRTWTTYMEGLGMWAGEQQVELMHIPDNCSQPSHMFYMVMPTLESRSAYINHMKSFGIQPAFHYQPLHSSVAGRKFGRTVGALSVTDRVADCLVRLPLWAGMSESQVERVLSATQEFTT